MKSFLYRLFFCISFLLCPYLVEAKKEITFVYEDYPPYEYSSGNSLEGISATKVKRICHKLGYSPRFVFAPWARALNLVKNGEVDGIFSLNRTVDREMYMTFSTRPIAWSEERLISLKNRIKPITHFEQLKPHTIGVVASYTYGKAFDDLQLPKKEVASGNENLIARLRKGWLDVIVMNRIVFDFYVAEMKLPKNDFIVHPLVVNAEDLYIGFSKKSVLGSKIISQFDQEL